MAYHTVKHGKGWQELVAYLNTCEGEVVVYHIREQGTVVFWTVVVRAQD